MGPSLQVGEQGIPVLGIDTGVGEVVGEEFRLGRYSGWSREEIRRRQSRFKRALPPEYLVQQVVYALGAFHRRQQRRLGGPLHRVTAQPADENSVRIVDADFPAQDLRILVRARVRSPVALVHLHVANHPIRQRPC